MGIFKPLLGIEDKEKDPVPATPAEAAQAPFGPTTPTPGAGLTRPSLTRTGVQRSARSGGGEDVGRRRGRRRFGGGRASVILAGDLGQANIGRRTLGGQ